MSSTILVHVCIFIFNFLASIIQGLTGFGDAVLLHVLWYTACTANPEVFQNTALGPNSVSAVTLLMYVRIIFSAPLVAYLSLSDGLFSWSMTIAMAVPSTALAIVGVFIFQKLQYGDTLKEVLGISSLIFAVSYVIILAGKYVMKQKKVRPLMEKTGVRTGARTKTGEDAIPVEFPASSKPATDVSTTNLPRKESEEPHATTARHEKERESSNTASAPQEARPRRHVQARDVVLVSETTLLEEELAAAAGREAVDGNGHSRDEDEEQEEQVYLSLETGSPFTRHEAQPIPITEGGPSAPPLTPSKISPTSTMTYTRVRVNRNLDANGRIKLKTKVGASISSGLSGIMGSLTGVGAPPQIIFILLMDVPQYIIRVNFAMQSIPSALVRFIIACAYPLFRTDMIPIFINALIAGYIGVYIGAKLGKMVGPKTYNLFVLSILLLASLTMITESATLLVVMTAICTVATIVAAWWEKKQETTAKIAAQRALEAKLATETLQAQRQQQQQCPTASSSPPPAYSAPSSATKELPPTPAARGTRRPPTVVTVPQTATVSDTRGDSYPRDSPAGSGGSGARGYGVQPSSDSEDASPPLSRSGSMAARVRKAELNRPPSLFHTPTTPTPGAAAPTFTVTAATGSNQTAAHPASPTTKVVVVIPREQMKQEETTAARRKTDSPAAANGADEEEELPL